MTTDDRDEMKALREVLKRSAPMMSTSAVFLSIWSEAMLKEPIPLLQFALAVFMDKPMAFLVREGDVLPENLQRIARHVEYYTETTLEEATTRLVKKMKGLKSGTPIDFTFDA